MFKKEILLIGLSTILMFSLSAQDLKDGNGDMKATIEASGVIKDVNNMPIGQFMPNGEIKDANGALIGSIVGDNFKDMNNAVIGSINSSGEVLDMNNMKIGEVPTTTTIKNSSGQQIGTASANVDKKWLAAYYFFYFNSIF